MAVTAPKARRFKRATSADTPNRLTQRISLVVTDAEWDRICNWGESDPMARSLNAQLRAVIMAAVDAGIRPGIAPAVIGDTVATPPLAPAPKPRSDSDRMRAHREFQKQLAARLSPKDMARYKDMTAQEKRLWNAAARKALAAGNPLPDFH